MMMSMGLTVSHDTQGPETPERPPQGRFGSAIASNYVALVVQVVVLLALTPFIVGERGRETLGAWAIVLAVSGYIRLLDLGFGQATSRYMATHADRLERQVLLASSMAVLSVVGLVGIVGGVCVAAASDSLFGPQEGLPGALALMSIATGLQVPLNTYGNALFGLRRIVTRNGFVVARSLGGAAAIVITIAAGGGLMAFVTAQATTELAVMAVQAIYCHRRIPDLHAAPRDVDRHRIREIAGFSAASFGLSVATQLAFYSDGLIIGGALGAVAVGIYSVAARIADGTSLLLSQFADVFLPEFAKHDATDRLDRSRRLFVGGVRTTLFVGYPLVGLMMALGGPLVTLWVGDGFEEAWTPLALLAGTLAVTSPLRFGMLWAIGAGRHGRIATYAIVESLCNIVFSIILVGSMGIDGVALSTFVTISVTNGWVVPRLIGRGLEVSLRRTYIRPIAIATLSLVPLGIATRLAVAPAVNGEPLLTVLAAVGWLAAALAVLAVTVLRPEDRAWLRGRVRGLRSAF
jgi:O-antigen/teichoic acid export membrane protein